MVFLLVCILCCALYFLFRKIINSTFICLASSYVFSGFIVSSVTISGCADGWISSSIGIQGACSHHGGVIDYLNIFGWLIFLLAIGYLISRKINSIKPSNLSETYPNFGYNKDKKIYYLKTNSRPQEYEIRQLCEAENINMKFEHSISNGEFIVTFTFFSESDLQNALKN